jgi:hypothetical protein
MLRGWTSSSFAPSNFRCFCVDTTVPMTRAICISPHIPVVDNADDAGINRRLGGMEREAGLLAANEEDLFADTRANGVDRHERPADRLMIG